MTKISEAYVSIPTDDPVYGRCCGGDIYDFLPAEICVYLPDFIEDLEGENMGSYGKIKSVEEVENVNTKGKNGGEYNGVKVTTTDDREYLILIDNDQQCCENWGYIYLNDDPEEFVGKQIIDIHITNNADEIHKSQLEVKTDVSVECADVMFVDFVMEDATVLQLAVYNEHNGFYGHDILFVEVSEGEK